MTADHLALGVMPSVPTAWLATAIRRLRGIRPQLQVSLRAMWADHSSLAAVREGSVDLALLIGPIGDPRLSVTTLCSLAAQAFVGPDNPLAGHRSLQLTDLLHEPTFRRPEPVDVAWREHWLHSSARAGREPRFVTVGATTEQDAILAIGTTRAVGYAPSNWAAGSGLIKVPVIDGPVAPVQVIRPLGHSSGVVHEFCHALASAVTSAPAAEARVAGLACLGWTNKEIAMHCRVSVRTVDAQISSLLRRYGVRNRTELMSRWQHESVVDLD